jgi:hypothetical protein
MYVCVHTCMADVHVPGFIPFFLNFLSLRFRIVSVLPRDSVRTFMCTSYILCRSTQDCQRTHTHQHTTQKNKQTNKLTTNTHTHTYCREHACLSVLLMYSSRHTNGTSHIFGPDKRFILRNCLRLARKRLLRVQHDDGTVDGDETVTEKQADEILMLMYAAREKMRSCLKQTVVVRDPRAAERLGIQVCFRLNVCLGVRVRVNVRLRLNVRVRVRVNVCLCLCLSRYVSICVSLRLCVFVSQLFCRHTCAYMSIHTYVHRLHSVKWLLPPQMDMVCVVLRCDLV